MRVRKRQVRYIEEHFRWHSDAHLAKALGEEKHVVQAILKRHGLRRTKADQVWIHEHPNEPLPPYTGQIPVPWDPYPLGPRDYLVALAAAVISLVVYVRTLAPTVTCEDGGELITAAYTLGIAHPPGYPIWCLLGKLFTIVLPFGTIAWRVSFMSAFLGAVTVFIACLLALKLARNRWAAFAVALALAFSAEFWEQCVIAEVYSLNAFFIVLCLLLLVSWYESRNNRILLVFALVYGLGLCNHNTMHFLAPLFGLFILLVDREPWRRWKLYASMAVLTFAGLGVYAYLPIRSAANPPVDWGNPETWENFWDVIRRKQYTFGFVENARTPTRTLRQIGAFLGLYANEFTPWLVWLPVLGAAAAWRRDRYKAGLLIALFVWIVVGFILILNFDLDKQSIWVNNVFWIPAYFASALLMAPAIAWLASLKRPVGPVAAAVMAVACAVLPLITHYHRNDKSEYYWAYDYGVNILRTLDQDAIYFPTADHATFPALYLQAVEGVRPDVTIANKYGYPEEDLYQDMPTKLRRGFRKIPTEAQEHVIEEWVIAHTDRPVYFTKKRSLGGLPDKTVVTAGLLYKVVDAGAEPENRDYWSDYTWHTLEAEDTRGELTAEYILSDYCFARGRDYLAKGDAEKGLEAFEMSIAVAGETKESLNNLGSACAEHGQFDVAEDYFSRALALDPTYDLSLRNLGKLHLQRGRVEQALATFQRILEHKSGDPEAHWMIVRCLKDLGRFDDALELLDRMARAQPKDDRVYREMGFIFLNEKRDVRTARQLFARSLSLNPDQPDLAILAREDMPLGGSEPGTPDFVPPVPHPTPRLPNVPLPQVPQMPGK